MSLDAAALSLVGITFLAATVNGALGYGFSSLTVPVALLFYSNRLLNPALVLVEVVVNSYALFVNRRSLPRVWKRTLPIVGGLIPGVLIGSFLLSSINPGIVKLVTYAILLPLILLQASGLRRSIAAERAVGLPFGSGIGILYSVTTISGPPIALLLNNQGYVREDFRASLSIVRIVESTLTAIAYFFLGLYSRESAQLIPLIVPSVIIGIPLGVFLIRRIEAETFRRICMSFDAWIVGFGLSRVLIDVGILSSPLAYVALVGGATIDLCLLLLFFKKKRSGELGFATVGGVPSS